MYTPFDVSTWKRRSAYAFFKTYDNPFFNICTHLEVGPLHSWCKQEGLSFHLTMMHYAAAVVNDFMEFKLRIKDGSVVLCSEVDCGSTVLSKDEVFSFCYFKWNSDLRQFVANAEQVMEAHFESERFDPRSDALNLIYFSAIPWVSFTSISHAKRFNSQESIPLITFGKYFTENGQLKLPISIEVNHALVDGYHVGQYLTRLQANLLENRPEAGKLWV